MRKFLDLHDKQILKTVINPVNGHIQILISYHTDKLMEIRIKGIKKFMLDNLECISLFFESYKSSKAFNKFIFIFFKFIFGLFNNNIK